MRNKITMKPLAAAIGTAMAASLMSISAANADQNPFSMNELSSGYMVASSHGEGKCGEGKCGGEAKGDEGKCGEGKCGGEKTTEGKCGEGKEHKKGQKMEGEGKCGEGKCGGSK